MTKYNLSVHKTVFTTEHKITKFNTDRYYWCERRRERRNSALWRVICTCVRPQVLCTSCTSPRNTTWTCTGSAPLQLFLLCCTRDRNTTVCSRQGHATFDYRRVPTYPECRHSHSVRSSPVIRPSRPDRSLWERGFACLWLGGGLCDLPGHLSRHHIFLEDNYLQSKFTIKNKSKAIWTQYNL